MKAFNKDEPFTLSEVEAALCVWETILKWVCDEQCKRPEWEGANDGYGAYELRMQSMVLGRWCLAVIDICEKRDPQLFDGMAWDWEVIPLVLGYAMTADGQAAIYAQELRDYRDIAELVYDRVKRDEFIGKAKAHAALMGLSADLIDDHPSEVDNAIGEGQAPKDFVTKLALSVADAS